MPLRRELSDQERDSLTSDVNELDKVYLERMKKSGIDPALLEQFKNLSLELEKQEDDEK